MILLFLGMLLSSWGLIYSIEVFRELRKLQPRVATLPNKKSRGQEVNG